MKHGHLSRYFEGVAAKLLSAVETRPSISHQHEFNGVQQLKQLFGTPRKIFDARFIYLGEDEDDFVSVDSTVTWYDSRENHPKRTEHRLYYLTTAVSEMASEGDLLVIGKRPRGNLLVLIVAAGTTAESQIRWLFGLQGDEKGRFTVVSIEDSRDVPLDLASRFVLEELGIEIESGDDFLELVLDRFSTGFPTTAIFSSFARESLRDVFAKDDPDRALVAWMEREEILFRTLERHFVADRISRGFGSDVDAFIDFSLSVQNRRKARAGFALENHLECIFKDHEVRYSRGAKTEENARPDFLFPGSREYRDVSFPSNRLRMLGVKSSCKERWRQVLAEADRIKIKHLLTLEPSISGSQTDEMQKNNLRLVLPKSLHKTYAPKQQVWLMNVADFIHSTKALTH